MKRDRIAKATRKGPFTVRNGELKCDYCESPITGEYYTQVRADTGKVSRICDDCVNPKKKAKE